MRRRHRVPPAVAALAVLASACGREPSILEPASPDARRIADLFWLMTGLGGAVFVLVVALLVGTALRGRGRTDDGPTPDDEPSPERDRRRGLRWIISGGVVLPVVVVVPLSVLTLFALDAIEEPGEDPVVVHVEGHRFWWEVSYPDAGVVTANEIHLPVDRDVQLVLTSADVIHSFWIPNLHGKRDLIPGEVNELWVRPEEVGDLSGVCAEYCGIQHAWMLLLVVVHEEDDFERWLVEQATPAPEPDTEDEALGLSTFLEVGCASCHTIQGTPADGELGPDLTHIDSRRWLGAGVVPNTRGHLGGWISNTQGIKPGAAMPPMPLTGRQLTALLDYLDTLE